MNPSLGLRLHAEEHERTLPSRSVENDHQRRDPGFVPAREVVRALSASARRGSDCARATRAAGFHMARAHRPTAADGQRQTDGTSDAEQHSGERHSAPPFVGHSGNVRKAHPGAGYR